ncbi:hypothetical protein [Amycolatopsis regifaucium]|uniref:DUF5666 domain-containing protein n=1 Tax=Amycolatopsis regifaucium TaxID=546365 RepID=A0A154M4C3_9PSEU|nr:hypothetical protein [Amycolatopsis regifaucium]KZB79458.1 hypothetical protein AVL48_17940 [Amycolatopsis regifaucium]OKA07640.1 hypothetical protein ATP06_0217625 [Amycolatopsis regifaucium]SFH06544.1 hypothetical protein SAMN04489731_102288 [Amycolatopsis regifaucium]
MKRLLSTVMAIAALGFATGCDGTSAPRDTAPADVTGGGVTTEVAPTASTGSTTSSGGGGGRTEDPGPPPGVPGSPIEYDHTRIGAEPKIAKSDIEGDIRKACGPGLCGVKVVITGKGDCTAHITPSPVKPGGRVTVTAAPCKTEVTEETTTSENPPSSSEQPGQTTSG